MELDLSGKTPPICRGCFDHGMEPPCSVGGRYKNVRQAKNKAKQCKKRRRDVAVEASRRRGRRG
eukprot:scaffold37567_cov272-Skeletonema_dohrnii-CCMP3373.AAC.1